MGRFVSELGFPLSPVRDGAFLGGRIGGLGGGSGGGDDGLGSGAGAGVDEGHEGAEVEGADEPVPFDADFFQAAQQELSRAEVVLDVGEGALAALASSGVLLFRFGSGHALGLRRDQYVVFIAADLAVIGLRAQSLRAQWTGGALARVGEIAVACLRTGGDLVDQSIAGLQGLAVRAPVQLFAVSSTNASFVSWVVFVPFLCFVV